MGKHADEFDAEAMIEEIRSLSKSAQDSVSDEFRASLAEEQSIQGNLRKMNQSCTLQTGAAGLLGPLRKILYALLAPLLEQINSFHAHTVRVANQLLRVLEGEDSTLSGEIAEKNRRRIELLSQLSRRIEEYDELDIDARLKSIEERLESKDSEA